MLKPASQSGAKLLPLLKTLFSSGLALDSKDSAPFWELLTICEPVVLFLSRFKLCAVLFFASKVPICL